MNLRPLYDGTIGRIPGLKKICQRVGAPLVRLFCRSRGLIFPRDFPIWSQLSWTLGDFTEEDLQTFQNYRRLIHPGDTVLDIGANLGIHTRKFSKIIGNSGRVFSFEPTPNVFECLSYNTKSLHNCTCIRKAVYRKNTTLKFAINKVNCSGNSVAVEGDDESQIIEVDAVSLDSWLEQAGIGHVDFVKIDVEGAECDVLAGIAKPIQDNPNIVLSIEYCPANLEKFGVSPDQFLTSINKLGLKVFRQDATENFQSVTDVLELEVVRGDLDYINVLAVHNAAKLNAHQSSTL